MKVSENFMIQELVHPDIYNHPAIGDRCIDFIHPSTGETLETIKQLANEVITINNWVWGGSYKNSGLRLPSGNIGAALSSHRFGCGFDLKPTKDMSAEQLHEFILDNNRFLPSIIRMESIEATPTWVHIEIGSDRDVSVDRIKVFSP